MQSWSLSDCKSQTLNVILFTITIIHYCISGLRFLLLGKMYKNKNIIWYFHYGQYWNDWSFYLCSSSVGQGQWGWGGEAMGRTRFRRWHRANWLETANLRWDSILTSTTASTSKLTTTSIITILPTQIPLIRQEGTPTFVLALYRAQEVLLQMYESAWPKGFS